MGIDARMFVRNTGKHLTETEVRSLAARMCATIGHQKFFIMRGDKPWHDKGGRHALSIVEETVGDYLAENQEWWIESGYTDNLEALQAQPQDRAIWTQDGDPVIAEEGEQLISVHLWSRYYGPGYERGDWPTIRMTAEFLEAALPGREVWYGGDSSGVCAVRFDAKARDAINRHYIGVGHDPYVGAFGKWDTNHAPACGFCADRPMDNFGGGGGDSFYSCAGCGKEVVVMADGRTVEKSDDDKSISETLHRARGEVA